MYLTPLYISPDIFHRKIHILGASKVGYLIAHSLRSTTPTNITLHFHRLRQADLFNALYGLTILSSPPHPPPPPPPPTNIPLHFPRLRQAALFNALYGLTILSSPNPPSPLPSFRDGFGYEMKDSRMRRAVPFIPAILDSPRKREYVPSLA